MKQTTSYVREDHSLDFFSPHLDGEGALHILIIEKRQEYSSLLNHLLEIVKNKPILVESTSLLTDVPVTRLHPSVKAVCFDYAMKETGPTLEEVRRFADTLPLILLIKQEEIAEVQQCIGSLADGYYVKKTTDIHHLLHYIALALGYRTTMQQLKNKMESARESEMRFRSIVELEPDGIVITDENKKVLYANPSAYRFLNRSKEDLPDMVFPYTVSPSNTLEIVSTSGGSAVRYFELCGAKMLWDGVHALLISFRDITQRKISEDQLRNALEELKFALASERVLLEELDRKNKDLVELSITDGLTGLFNHRYVQELFDFEFKRAKRYHGYRVPLSCMMIDIDLFKKINDTYGHQCGDMALRELAAIIKKNTREVDICGRYGGEEFIIITGQDAEGALLHATKIHKAIEAFTFLNKTHNIHMTVSIGIAEYRRDIKTKRQMIERADFALYQAKQDGRNLIRVWKEKDLVLNGYLDNSGITGLKSQVTMLTSRMRAAYMESTYALLKAVDAKDAFTLKHSINVSRYSEGIARSMHLSEEEVEIIKYAALLHDIGKIGIDKEVLLKKGPLTRDESNLLKKHPSIGVSILKDVKFLERELPIIAHHHEWYNGNGYPHGLSGREIPLGAQIIAVADTYDALKNKNKGTAKKMTGQRIQEEILKGKGIQFSPEIVDVFIVYLKGKARMKL